MFFGGTIHKDLPLGMDPHEFCAAGAVNQMIAVLFGRDDVGAGLRTGKSALGIHPCQAVGNMTARGHVHPISAKYRGLMTYP